jgi:class 3 adenylate cyclase
MAGNPPSGTVTFLLTDLEASTHMWEQDPEAMKVAMVRHDEILEKTFAENRGFVFSRMGDGMAAAFATARDAISAAAAIQQALASEPWRTTRPLRARIGVHTDEAVIVDDTGYTSLPINRCSRLMTAAHGGQVVVSGATEMLLRGQLPDSMELVDLGEHRLRDLGRPTRIFQLVRDGDRVEFPPLRTLDSFPGNLPAQASSFIGRQVEVSRVAAALDESRVVTITGSAVSAKPGQLFRLPPSCYPATATAFGSLSLRPYAIPTTCCRRWRPHSEWPPEPGSHLKGRYSTCWPASSCCW